MENRITKKPKVPLSVKIPIEMKKAINGLAEKDDRSVSQIVVRLLKESATLDRELKKCTSIN